jgi:hypothetical protein
MCRRPRVASCRAPPQLASRHLERGKEDQLFFTLAIYIANRLLMRNAMVIVCIVTTETRAFHDHLFRGLLVSASGPPADRLPVLTPGRHDPDQGRSPASVARPDHLYAIRETGPPWPIPRPGSGGSLDADSVSVADDDGLVAARIDQRDDVDRVAPAGQRPVRCPDFERGFSPLGPPLQSRRRGTIRSRVPPAHPPACRCGATVPDAPPG